MSKENTAVAEPEIQSYRLPRTVVPSRYEIKLAPDLKNFVFAGEETVHVNVHKPVKEFLLNALELEVKSASVSNGSGTKYDATIEMDTEEERVKLSFPQDIPAGDWKLHITFTGVLNDKLHGFYRSTYKDSQGNDKVLATTQFEATDARRAFPCWDEPDFKAVYQVTLEIDENLTSISNAGLASEKKLGNGKKEMVFKDTIKMSTYLVAFVVGEFEASEPVMAGKTPIRIWAVPGKKHLGKFAEGIGVHSLTFFADYYGVPYPGDKLDMIAIPDFAFGAMENLGCITYRESALLVDEKTASHAEQERVADVIAHEIAHMWFGDLTTMSWWNGIWLNEAFATFAEMMAVDAWKPEWKRWDTFGVSRAAAFVVDGLKSTRPIEFPVRRPEECEGMFDVLTYEKGASVLRQLEQYIEVPVFQKGISLYLNKHKFANTETSDLWSALGEASKQPVVELMDSWIFQKGYPMVSVEIGKDGQSLELSQQRFFYMKEGDGSKQLFQIPVMLRVKTDKGIVNKKVLMTDEKMNVEFGQKIDWAVVNEGGHGFYRVRYSPDMLKKLTDKVFENLIPIERFNLVNDTYAMVLAGHTSLKDFVTMIALFKEETDKNVWSAITSAFSYFDRVIEDKDRPKLEAFIGQLLEPALNKLGWEPKKGENELTGQLRGMLINTLGTVGNHAATQKKAAELYEKYKSDRTSIAPDVVPAVISIMAATGDKTRYEEFVKEWKAGKTPQDEERFLFALAGFRDKALLTQTLERCLNGEVRTQNAPYLLRSVMLNPKGRDDAWQFATKNWDAIRAKYPDNSIPRMCEGIIALVDKEKEVNDFFKQHPFKQGSKTLEQHLERLTVAVKFKQREGSNFGSVF